MDLDMDYKTKQVDYYLVNLLGPYAAKAIQAMTGKRSLNTRTQQRRDSKDAEKWRTFEKTTINTNQHHYEKKKRKFQKKEQRPQKKPQEPSLHGI